jgi:putative DNA primase/helicase
MNLRHVASMLGGEVRGGKVVCPGPGHSRVDRSMAVWLDGDRLRVDTLCPDDDWRDCQAYVRQRLGMPQWEPSKGAPARPLSKVRAPDTKPRPTPAKSDTGEFGRRIWVEAIDPRGTIAEDYLSRERGLPGCINDTLALTLRYHGNCPFRDDDEPVRAPALIAAMRDPYAVMCQCQKLGELEDVERWILRKPELVTSIQRIRLDEQGRKVERKTLGTMGDAVVFVSSIWECFYGGEATIAEGVETSLAMRSMGFKGCVAVTGASRFKNISIPYHWGTVTIGAENDAASETAWHTAGERFTAEGRTVMIWKPPSGFKDANNLIQAKGAKP